MLEMIESNTDALIVLTDGQIYDAPKSSAYPSCKVAWILTDNGNVPKNAPSSLVKRV